MSETWQEKYARTGERFNKGLYVKGAGLCSYWVRKGESCMSDGNCECVRKGRILSGYYLRRLYGYPDD